ncbi:MAG: peptidyl-prolyl cis-trans isomerase, partial [Pseudomonadota bacterium]|nr:peptidyl-prolyl cis-trans isomerase [Pseudomonadota bacterium]
QKVEIKSWTGPVTSEYGSHLVYLNSATESYTPSLDEVKNIVINDIILQKQNNAVKDYLTELRSEYEIEILADLNEISK